MEINDVKQTWKSQQLKSPGRQIDRDRHGPKQMRGSHEKHKVAK